MLGKPPLQIPGTSIRIPDIPGISKITCKVCQRSITKLEKVTDPVTKKVIFVCPFCGAKVR